MCGENLGVTRPVQTETNAAKPHLFRAKQRPTLTNGGFTTVHHYKLHYVHYMLWGGVPFGRHSLLLPHDLHMTPL